MLRVYLTYAILHTYMYLCVCIFCSSATYSIVKSDIVHIPVLLFKMHVDIA